MRRVLDSPFDVYQSEEKRNDCISVSLHREQELRHHQRLPISAGRRWASNGWNRTVHRATGDRRRFFGTTGGGANAPATGHIVNFPAPVTLGQIIGMLAAGETCFTIATKLGIPPPASFAVAAICGRYPSLVTKAEQLLAYLERTL